MGDANKVIYFVVGDRGLNSGSGIYVEDLETMKTKLLGMKPEGEWQLVISMHGAENALATVGGNLRTKPQKGYYDAAAIQALFGDEAFKKWKESYGPAWVTMNSCQVNKHFETVLIQSLTKSKTKQQAQGLGEGCRPYTDVRTYVDSKNNEVKTRSQYNKLGKGEKAALLEILSELNKKFGYFGGRPVPETHLLHYYFEEEPTGGWPVVTVSVDKKDTGISYYNRTQNARFLGDLCTKHTGGMRQRVPAVPQVD
jgi:hypothetical protein